MLECFLSFSSWRIFSLYLNKIIEKLHCRVLHFCWQISWKGSLECSVFFSLQLPFFFFCFLGIIPPHHKSHALVMNYRKEQYWDVHHALRVIRFINDSTPQVDVFLRIHQLESGKLPRNLAFPLVSCCFDSLLSILANFMLYIYTLYYILFFLACS